MSLFNSFLSPLQSGRSARGDSADLGPTVRPAYEVKETADAYGLVVYLPGVAREGLEITAEEDTLRIVGQRAWKRPENWVQLYREVSESRYELVLSHDHQIDVNKIHAELNDGVLRVSLPKTEAIKPRKIAVA